MKHTPSKLIISVIAAIAVLFNLSILHAQEEMQAEITIELPPDFSYKPFYLGIPNPDGIAYKSDDTLLVVSETRTIGVFTAVRGDTFDIGDAFSTTGPPFMSPDDLLLYTDGTVFVTDGGGYNSVNTIFKIPANGGAPESFVTSQTIKVSNYFNPFGIAYAPSRFSGPNVVPGELIVADNGFRMEKQKAVWSINPTTGATRAIAKGKVFVDGPLQVAFSPDGKLYVYQNYESGSSRIIILDADGKATPFVPYIPGRGSIAIYPVSGDIYFGLGGNTFKIWCIAGEGGYPKIFASGFNGISDIEFRPDGKALYLGTVDAVLEITGPFLEPLPTLAFALGSVKGEIINEKDNSPYSDMTVGAYHGDKLISNAETDSRGRYELMVQPGEYTVRPQRGQGIEEADKLVITVNAGEESKVSFHTNTVELPEILLQSMALYKSIKGYRDTTEVHTWSVKPGMDDRSTSQFLFAYEKPNHIRVENMFESSMGIDLFSNSEKMVTYMGTWKQYTEEVTPEEFTSADLRMVQSLAAKNILTSDDPLKNLKKGIEEVKNLGNENLNGISTNIIEITQPVSSLGTTMVPGNVGEDILIPVRLWIGSDDFLIRKLTYELDMGEIAKILPDEIKVRMGDYFNGMKITLTETHSDIEINPDFSSKDFAFIPPEGAELVDRFTPPGSPGTKNSKIDKPAPVFTLKDIEGNEAKLADYKGKVVLVDFWATWCGPCIQAMPHIQALSEIYEEDDVIVLGINSLEREKDKVEPFLKDHKITYRILLDSKDEVIGKFGVSGIPTFFIIDKKGLIRYAYTGMPSNRQIIQQNLEELLVE